MIGSGGSGGSGVVVVIVITVAGEERCHIARIARHFVEN